MLSTAEQWGLHGRFLAACGRTPDRPAVVTPARTWSYRELFDLVACCAAELLELLGGAPGRVGILGNRSPEAYAGLLAALCAGGTAVPLHPEHPPQRLAQQIEAAGVTAIVADGPGSRARRLLGGELPTVYAAGRTSWARRPGAAAFEPLPASPDAMAYLMFTSGSTGAPKAVPITHANAAALFAEVDARYDFTEVDRFSQTFDLTFDLSMFDLFGAWGAGAAVVPVPTSAYRELPRFLRGWGVTVWFSAPSVIAMARRLGQLATGALPTLRWSLFCGEALLLRDAEDWRRAALGSLLENLYGPTEATIACTAYRWPPGRPSPVASRGFVPIGRPFSGVRTLVRADGELCLAGPQVFAGYLDPGADRFCEHGGPRWYRTGDRVTQGPDGELRYAGRVDDQVQLRGLRVEPGEIEYHLMRCPGVENAVVVPAPSGDDQVLVAFWTGIGNRVPDADSLGAHLIRFLPRALLPARYEHMDDLPRNGNRKIDRKALAAAATTLLNLPAG